jgi:hypothetical protein
MPASAGSCAINAFDALPLPQRNKLVDPSVLLDPEQPLDAATLGEAFGKELIQRIGLTVFGNPNGAEQERPGRMRIYIPQGEDFFNQVRICSINDLRPSFFIPTITLGDYLPAEIQQLEIGAQELARHVVVQRLVGIMALFQKTADRHTNLFSIRFGL